MLHLKLECLSITLAAAWPRSRLLSVYGVEAGTTSTKELTGGSARKL